MKRIDFMWWRRSSLTLVAGIAMAVLIGGCTPSAHTQGVPMSGDPGFDEATLPPEVSTYYQAVFNTLRRPDYYPNALAAAQTGNLYQIGRVVNVHVTTLLTLFRYTHDLRLLDAVDVPMQASRAVLADTPPEIVRGRFREDVD